MIIPRRRESAIAETAGLEPGTNVAGYRIERLLGSGGMGAVYEATQLSLKRPVALKLIAPGIAGDQTVLSRFRREGELQAAIDHPHILPVYEAGEDHGRLFIAMRLVRGPTLKQLISSRKLSLTPSLRILTDIASALDAAHAAGLVHRDVKPQNILVELGRHAYLADFGLSRGRGDATLTRSGQLLGSVSYIPPELVRGERVTAAGDVYSFTCVAYECLVGLVPYPRDSDHAVLHAHVWDPIPQPSEIRPELPPALDEVIARGMAKHPSDRPATATEVAAALAAVFADARDEDGEGLPATIPLVDDDSSTVVRQPIAVSPGKPRHAFGLAPLIAAGVLIVAAMAGWITRPAPKHVTTVQAKPVSAAVQPNPAYAAALSTALVRLERAQRHDATALRKARTAASQAVALGHIADDYSRARTAVQEAPAGRHDTASRAAVARELGRVATDYGLLASAARQRNKALYGRRRAALTRDQRALAASVRALGRLGYRVR